VRPHLTPAQRQAFNRVRAQMAPLPPGVPRNVKDYDAAMRQLDAIEADLDRANEQRRLLMQAMDEIRVALARLNS